MAKYIELTSNGLSYLTENEIFQDLYDQRKAIDPNWNLDPSTPDGMIIALMAERYREIIEAVVQAYSAKDSRSAIDLQLDIISSITGTIRSLGTGTVFNVLLSGTNGTLIPKGSLIKKSGYELLTDTDLIIGTGGTIAGTATNQTIGQIQLDLGSATVGNTISGWSSVSITGIELLGEDRQSDSLLRAERQRSVSRQGNNQVDNMISELFSVDGVSKVAVYENSTGSNAFDPDLNPYSLPAHSLTPIVLGGSDSDVAKAIYIKKNPGCALNQSGTPAEYLVVSEVHPSNNKLIKFGRPSLIDINIDIELSDPLSNLPLNIETLIRDAIILYTTGSLISPNEGFDSTGFDIGEDVPVRRIDTPINQVIGQYKGSYISNLTVNSLSGGAVSIDYFELANFFPENINVVVL